ncbi:MAG: SLC13 family permease [Bacteroidales bacterium]|nr:SLC13 family permease [Bacteroidales bacterium]MDY6171077.1 SLC13 family permease [Candidatus Cryptobacteroides sp.]
MSDKKFSVKYFVLLPLVIAVTLFLWLVPIDFFGVEGLNVVQQRMIAIFAFAALMWMFEIIPAWTTSVVIIVLMLLTISNKGFGLFINNVNDGSVFIDYTAVMAAFANPIIMLFLGGFVLAIAATKVGLDVQLAKILLKPFGTNPKTVMLGILSVVAIFSMFMSNTATAAMMLAFLTPVLKSLPADGKGRIGLALAIPVAANIGGIGTPIGTPPNAIALGYLNDMGMGVTFMDWMLRMVPFVIVMILIAWGLLLFLFPFKAKKIELKIEGGAKPGHHTIVVYVTFALTILLWITEQWTGINSNIVALIPFAVFSATGVIDKKDLSEIEWSVLWMVAGGLALGVGLMKTGLASTLVNAIPFSSMSPFLVMVAAGVIGYLISNFLSHSSAANLLCPIIAVIGSALSVELEPFGGVRALLIGLAISTSVAMLLPISTPPNAIASSTGLVETKDMLKVGVVMGVVGLVLGYALLMIVGF